MPESHSSPETGKISAKNTFKETFGSLIYRESTLGQVRETGF